MKFIILFCFFFLFFIPIAYAQSLDNILPNNLPSVYSPENGYNPSYCLLSYDILANDKIYTCRKIITRIQHTNTAAVNNSQLYIDCWNAMQGPEPFQLGIILKRTVSASYKAPPDVQKTCDLKSKLDPENPIACSQPIAVSQLVQGAFWNKFPMDLLTDFSSNPPSTPCPSFTIRGQTFELCYLNKLTTSLKYVLLVIFIISSVIAL